MGRVAYDIDALTPRYMKTIRWASYVDRHKDLTAAGIHLDPQNLPADWQKKYDLVRQHLGERMGYTTATASEFRARIAEHFDASDEIELTKGPTQENELTTLNPKEAMTVDGFVIAVPKAYARKIVGEYTKERWALKWLWDKPTDVWRAVVLNLRVGWLVNNIVGNSFLYLLKNAGPQGIAAYARALKRSERGEIFTEDQMMDLFPEQWHGTFGTTQMPSGVAGRITTSNLNPVHWLRRGDIYTERSARLAYLSRQAAKSPEVKAAVKRMQLQGKRWNEVAEDVIKGDPKLAERISDEVNAGLGDYFSMSTFERNAVRRVAPFYAWYKAITKITLALPLDYPGRTMILAKLGQIGAEVDVDDPPWLRGGINLPGGRVLGTQAMNPLTTPVTIGRALGGEDWLSGQQRLGLLHPVFSTLINAQQRRSGGFIENIGREGAEMIRNLPPGRVFFPPERASYEGSAYLREGLGYLGVPIKKPSKELRREGMTPNQRVLADHLEWRKQAVKSAQQYGLLDKKTHRLPKQLQEAVVHRTGRYSAYAGAGLKRGDDDYQQKAFLIDVRTLQRRGAITDAVARKARKWVRSAAKHEIEREREKLSERHFGQGVIYRARLQINRAAFRSLVRELEEDGELTGEQAERAITWANEAGVEALESEREAAFARYYPDREYVEAIGDLR
jgi:hypothetical protein